MIITYGAFVSKTLDPQFIAYFCKYIELYTLTYNLDECLNLLASNEKSIKRIKKSGNKLMAEMIDGSQVKGDIEILDEGGRSGHNMPPRPESENTSAPRQSPPPEISVDETISSGKGRSVISVEPTWVKVQVNGQTRMFGVKVVPIYIKDDSSLISAILNDAKPKNWVKLVLKVLGRNFMKTLWKMWYNTITAIPFIGRPGPDGGSKTKNHVIYAQSIYRDRMFICLNYTDVANSPLLDNPNAIRKLQGALKWCSMIFIDPVNQMFHFCMTEFNGSCSVIHYRNLVASLGGGLSDAAQEIEQIQSTANSVFRHGGKRVQKIFGEMVAVQKFLDIRQHMNIHMLNESSNNYLSRPAVAKQMYERIKQITKMSNDQTKNKLMDFPTITDNEFDSFARIKCPKINDMTNFTRRVITNSLKWLDPQDKELVIKIIAFKGARSLSLGERNRIPNLVVTIKAFVKKARSEYSKTKDIKLAAFRALVFAFDTTSNFSKLNSQDMESKKDVILDCLYIFLSLTPRIFENIGEDV